MLLAVPKAVVLRTRAAGGWKAPLPAAEPLRQLGARVPRTVPVLAVLLKVGTLRTQAVLAADMMREPLPAAGARRPEIRAALEPAMLQVVPRAKQQLQKVSTRAAEGPWQVAALLRQL